MTGVPFRTGHKIHVSTFQLFIQVLSSSWSLVMGINASLGAFVCQSFIQIPFLNSLTIFSVHLHFLWTTFDNMWVLWKTCSTHWTRPWHLSWDPTTLIQDCNGCGCKIVKMDVKCPLCIHHHFSVHLNTSVSSIKIDVDHFFKWLKTFGLIG
jgi:hypothetical protein